MQIFLQMLPPRATAQEKQSTMRNGKHVFYKNDRLKKAESDLVAALLPHRPPAPFDGPLSLSVTWFFKTPRRSMWNRWKVTRPDTDNLNKLLKDIMTKLHFWADDAQVCQETIEKMWAEIPGIWICIDRLDEKKEDAQHADK